MRDRAERVSELIREEISRMLVKELKDPRIGFVTVTYVKLSRDLRKAMVFFTVHGSDSDKEKSMEGLTSAKNFIRRELGKKLYLKHIPEIEFLYDTSFDYGEKIDLLLKEIREIEKGNQ